MIKTLLIVGDPRGNHTLAALKKYPPESITVWEHPDNHYTIHQLCGKINVTDDLDKLNGMRFDVVIGNPPYGSGGNLAIRFLNKSLDLSDTVTMVLPLSVRKVSSLNKIRLDAICVEDIRLPDETFPGGIKTVRQTWVRTDSPRLKIKTLTTHPDFEFVKKGDSEVNVFVMRSGNAGKVLTEGYEDYEWSHYFIKAKDQQVIDNLLAIESELIELGKITNGMGKVSKHEIITTYMSHVSSC